MKTFSVIFLACLALGYCDESVLSSPRIVGGAPAPIAGFNYVVQVRRDHYGTGSWHQQCGGVLIHTRAVLTSAHCFHGVPYPLRWRIRAGEASRLDLLTGAERLVLNIFFHYDYNSISLQNNLAVVQLLTAMPLSANIDLAQLAVPAAVPPTGTVAILGWGATVFNGVPNTLLQIVSVPVIDHATCVASYANVHLFVGANNICVGITTGICARDEGGPLGPGTDVYGIASFIYGCGNTDFPGVFTLIAPYRSWIDGIVANI